MSRLKPWEDDDRYGVGTRVDRFTNGYGVAVKVTYRDGGVRRWTRTTWPAATATGWTEEP